MATWQQSAQIYTKYARNLALMYQKRQDIQSFVELLLSISAITIFGVFAIRPTLVTVTGLNREIESKRGILQQLDQKISALAEAQNIYDSHLDQILLLDEAVPASPLPDQYIRQLEGLARRHGVSIVGLNTNKVTLIGLPLDATAEQVPVDPAAPALDSFVAKGQDYQFEMNIVGDFEPLTAFIRDFEAMRRPMLTDVLSVRISSGDIAPGSLALSVTGRLVYLPNE